MCIWLHQYCKIDIEWPITENTKDLLVTHIGIVDGSTSRGEVIVALELLSLEDNDDLDGAVHGGDQVEVGVTETIYGGNCEMVNNWMSDLS